MPDDHAILLDEIQTLLDARPSVSGLARIEDTLAAGYARAMALEAERWRLERQLGEAARRLGEGTPRGDTRELARLARKMAVADRDLTKLRTLLSSLRDRARELRAA
jgi:hypothetical protein